MKNEKNYMGFLIAKIWQILKRFSRALSWAQTSYFWKVHCNIFVQKWTIVGTDRPMTKRHGTVDHDGTPQLSNCRKLEACMSTHHQKGSSNIKVIRNSSISDSECFLTREIKDLMTFQDSLYIVFTICSYLYPL